MGDCADFAKGCIVWMIATPVILAATGLCPTISRSRLEGHGLWLNFVGIAFININIILD